MDAEIRNEASAEARLEHHVDAARDVRVSGEGKHPRQLSARQPLSADPQRARRRVACDVEVDPIAAVVERDLGEQPDEVGLERLGRRLPGFEDGDTHPESVERLADAVRVRKKALLARLSRRPAVDDQGPVEVVSAGQLRPANRLGRTGRHAGGQRRRDPILLAPVAVRVGPQRSTVEHRPPLLRTDDVRPVDSIDQHEQRFVCVARVRFKVDPRKPRRAAQLVGDQVRKSNDFVRDRRRSVRRQSIARIEQDGMEERDVVGADCQIGKDLGHDQVCNLLLVERGRNPIGRPDGQAYGKCDHDPDSHGTNHLRLIVRDPSIRIRRLRTAAGQGEFPLVGRRVC